MFSFTVSFLKIEGSWARYPIPILARLNIGTLETFSSLNEILPPSGLISPMIM